MITRVRPLLSALALWLAVGTAGTSFGETGSLPLNKALRLAGGDQAELAHFEQCATDCDMCALLAASHLRKRDNHEPGSILVKPRSSRTKFHAGKKP